MSQKIIVVLILLYIGALLQVSFLVHFSFNGLVPNFVLLAVVALSFFEQSNSRVSLVAAVFGGLMLDMFSGNFIGFWVLVLLGIWFAIKKILPRYVRIPLPKKA